MTSKPVLVTGGGGFIGSNLVRALLAEGRSVRVLDDFSTGAAENLDGLAGGLEIIEGSLLDHDAVARAVEGASVVFHLAARGSVARSVEDPIGSHHANATGTLAVLDASRLAGVDRFVYSSSSSVYGGIDALPLHEGLPTVPASPYGVTKLAGEHYCRAFHRTYGFPTVSLRYFNVFGPRQSPDSAYAAVIPRFISALLSGERPVVQGDGGQSRDFTYVDNVVHANLCAAGAPDEALGRAFNVAQGGRYSLMDLLEALRPIVGSGEVEIEWAPPRPGDIRHSQADVTAARELLGYAPEVTFEEGLRRTVAWLAERAGAVRTAA